VSESQVTLERIDGPGEWEAFSGRAVEQTLYTVGVSFK